MGVGWVYGGLLVGGNNLNLLMSGCLDRHGVHQIFTAVCLRLGSPLLEGRLRYDGLFIP